jgi:lipopolysaccharide/colanic/teichoic acid biosynthesis glycosyltransferase
MRQAQRIILAPAEGEMRALEATVDDVPLLLLLGSLAPIALIVSCMIIRSGRRIFFARERVGCGGRIFKCFKFRTSLWSDIVIPFRTMPVVDTGHGAY